MKVAVVGASVAGAYFAYLAAHRGLEVHLFDPRAPWDKPCGGGITGRAMAMLRHFPAIASQAEAVTEFALTAPSGGRAEIAAETPLYLLPRVALGRILMDAAQEAGGALVPEQVRSVVRDGTSGWSLHTDRQVHRGYSYLVGADGAISTVRRAVDLPFARDDLIHALDCHLEVPGVPPRVALRFLGEGMGYLWLFAGRRFASVGVGYPASANLSVTPQELLRDFLAAEGLPVEIGDRARRWVIPFHRDGFARRYRLQGEGWSLVGDAAGLADPMTGEGIFYAVRSAELLADALIADRPQGYAAAVDQELRPELDKAFAITRDYFGPRFLNGLVWVARRSPSFRGFLAEHLSGHGSYRSARRAVKQRLPRILWELCSIGSAGRWRPRSAVLPATHKKTP